MTNLEKLLEKYMNRRNVSKDYRLYQLGHLICYGIIQNCQRCPVRKRKADEDGIYCGENYEDFVKLGKWAIKEAE